MTLEERLANVQQYINEAKQNPEMRGSGLTGHEMGVWDTAARESGSIGPDYVYGISNKLDSRGHGGDEGKLPWHITFSDQSAFKNSGPHGTWRGNEFHMTKEMETPDRLSKMKYYMKHGYNDGDLYFDSKGKQVK